MHVPFQSLAVRSKRIQKRSKSANSSAQISCKTVVVPIDFSDESLAALEAAGGFVSEPSQLHAVHVLPVVLLAEPGVAWEEMSDECRREHALETMREKLASAESTAAASLTEAHQEVLIGDPAHEIAAYAQKIDADLIVMPSHGRTGLSRLLMGSVAEHVMRLAHCPVLVLRS